MSLEYIREEISGYFITNFSSTADIEQESHQTIDISERLEPFVKLSFRFTDNEQITLGQNPTYRRKGAVQIDIYTKLGQGTKTSNLLAGTIENLFKRKSISGIEFSTPVTLTPVEILGWRRLTARCPFYYDS